MDDCKLLTFLSKRVWRTHSGNEKGSRWSGSLLEYFLPVGLADLFMRRRYESETRRSTANPKKLNQYPQVLTK